MWRTHATQLAQAYETGQLRSSDVTPGGEGKVIVRSLSLAAESLQVRSTSRSLRQTRSMDMGHAQRAPNGRRRGDETKVDGSGQLACGPLGGDLSGAAAISNDI